MRVFPFCQTLLAIALFATTTGASKLRGKRNLQQEPCAVLQGRSINNSTSVACLEEFDIPAAAENAPENVVNPKQEEQMRVNEGANDEDISTSVDGDSPSISASASVSSSSSSSSDSGSMDDSASQDASDGAFTMSSSLAASSAPGLSMLKGLVGAAIAFSVSLI